jgi:hypothetical protein
VKAAASGEHALQLAHRCVSAIPEQAPRKPDRIPHREMRNRRDTRLKLFDEVPANKNKNRIEKFGQPG